MRVFLDTSAFAKLYVQEIGSQKVFSLLSQADELAVSVICLPELISTLARLVREGNLSPDIYQDIKSRSLSDLDDMSVIQINSDVLHASMHLLESNTLRAMDAIHIACAQTLGVDLFVSADQRQLSAAIKSKLKVADVSH